MANEKAVKSYTEKLRGGGQSEAMVPVQQTQAMTLDAATAKLLELHAAGWECAQEVVDLEEGGPPLQGMLEGKGDPVEVTDRVTGEVRPLDTWVFVNGPLRLAVFSSAQLEKRLPLYVGQEVCLWKIGQTDSSKGNRVNLYRIAHRPVGGQQPQAAVASV